MPACQRCGEENPARAKFCLNCGADLGNAEQGREERKLVSILFVDLVGSTSRFDRADPEDVRDTLHAYHARVKQEMEAYGGTVEKFIGDAVMAVFGAPVSHGDDAERAVRAGLRVLSAIEDLNRKQGLGLTVRAAVNTGEAVVAVGGGGRAGGALAMGDVVNTASRMQSAAPPGGLVVGDLTYRATRDAIRYEPLAPLLAKGKRAPVQAWLAVAMAPVDPRSAKAAPMVGRDREIGLLQSIWERAVAERRPHLVTVIGPPGIGKSRLTREFSAAVQAHDGRVVRGRCLPYEEKTAYGAFAQQAKEIAGIFENDAPGTARSKLDVAAASLLPEREAREVASYLAILLGFGGEEPVEDRLPLFFSARRLLERVGVDRPTLLVTEDVHWADSGQLDLLEYLASHVRETSLVLLVLARPEFLDLRPQWGSGLAAQTTIPLEPLSPVDSMAVAAHLLAEGGGDLERLVQVAEGNPLFIEELAATVSEGGAAGTELPTTIKEAIAGRIDALPRHARTALLDASVVGKTFWRGVLGAISETRDLDTALEVLETQDLVRREPMSQIEGDTEFVFKHMLIREVAYATLPRAARRARHARVAGYVEQALGPRADELAAVLAHHWRHSGEAGRAVEYLLAAADRARAGWGQDDALRLYAEALELAGDDERLTKRIRLARGRALVDFGEFDAGSTELEEILPRLEGQDELEAILALLRAVFWQEEPDKVLSIGPRARELAERPGNEEFLGPALSLYALGYSMRGGDGDIERAIAMGDRALEVWVPGTRPLDLAVAYEMQAYQHYWIGEHHRAVELAQQSYRMGEQYRSTEPLLRGGGTVAQALIGMGRHEEALAILDSLIARSRDLDKPRWGAYAMNVASWALRDLCDFAGARRHNEEAVELNRKERAGFSEIQGLIDLIFADLAEGEVGRAQQAWPEVWERVREKVAYHGWLASGRLAAARAEIALKADGPEAAVDWSRKAIALAEPVRRLRYDTLARITLAEALLALRRPTEAIAELRTAVAGADALEHPPTRWQARAMLGKALYAAGEDGSAERAFAAAADTIKAFAATLSHPHAGSLMASGSVRDILDAMSR